MSQAGEGKILVADHAGVYVIKMSGDVRLTLCIPFDEFIEKILSQKDFESVLIDLKEAEGLDSTTLGLLVKLSAKYLEMKDDRAIILAPNLSIQRLLTSMGLDEICNILVCPETVEDAPSDFSDLAVKDKYDENLVKSKVLESHSYLMELNEKNRETFQDLVNTLRAAD
jgi:anti-anti-sigma factor